MTWYHVQVWGPLEWKERLCAVGKTVLLKHKCSPHKKISSQKTFFANTQRNISKWAFLVVYYLSFRTKTLNHLQNWILDKQVLQKLTNRKCLYKTSSCIIFCLIWMPRSWKIKVKKSSNKWLEYFYLEGLVWSGYSWTNSYWVTNMTNVVAVNVL